MDGLSDSLLRRWLMSDEDPDLSDISSRVAYLERRLYDDYEPSQFRKFRQRLDWWLANVGEDQQRRTLYKLVGSLFFVGRQEFESLCRAAFHGPIIRWLIDRIDLDVADSSAENQLNAAIERTWFCPVTDSMRINAFLKVNNIEGQKHRPDWRSLAKFGDPKKIRKFIAREKINQIVLLEDFVGTGTQMSGAVSYAARLISDFPVICCPLVVCPDGVKRGEALVKKYSNLTFEPVLILPPSSFIKYRRQAHEEKLFADVRKLTAAVCDRLLVKSGAGTHGFEGTGALVVLYSNCPNNTLPIVHDDTSKWAPLFPRIRRR